MLSPAAASVLLDDPETAERIITRAIEDALAEALPAQWEARARTFLGARHRPGTDYPGRADEAELAAGNRRLEDTARAFAAKAAVLRMGADDE